MFLVPFLKTHRSSSPGLSQKTGNKWKHPNLAVLFLAPVDHFLQNNNGSFFLLQTRPNISNDTKVQARPYQSHQRMICVSPGQISSTFGIRIFKNLNTRLKCLSKYIYIYIYIFTYIIYACVGSNPYPVKSHK